MKSAIERDGAMLYTGRSSAPKPHPAIKLELELRAFRMKALEKLGIVYEPLRAGPGKPSVAHGWTGE